MILTKYHALGNDYWVYDPNKNTEFLSVAFVQKLCDRHRGLGGDGVLVGPKPLMDDRLGVQIYNADGTLAEISGNGLTIFARYLSDACYVKANEMFYMQSSENCCVKAENHWQDMCLQSHITLGCGKVEDVFSWSPPLHHRIRYNLPEFLHLYKVNIGNPHCVVPIKNPTAELACDLGKILEEDTRFPHKTNVQFVDEFAETGVVKIEIWERGSGYTLGSGSSACAVACAYGYIHGLKKYNVIVQMSGGSLQVNVQNNEFSFVNRAHKIADVDLAFCE